MDCMKGKRVKTLKLIRNKLTDEGLDKMLPCFVNVITLNLSQNLLTERFIDRLIEFLPKLPNLKSLILSQNKIKERSVKARLDEIKKYDIVVSLWSYLTYFTISMFLVFSEVIIIYMQS